MMERSPSNQEKLFYAFDLDMVVPTDHLLRGIDTVLDLGKPLLFHETCLGLRLDLPATGTLKSGVGN